LGYVLSISNNSPREIKIYKFPETHKKCN
jgi:hypothetical protein